MTLKLDLRIANAEDAARERMRGGAAIESSGLPDATKAFLTDQLETNLVIFERQLSLKSGSMKADKLFEGDGYRISVRVNQGGGGLIASLRQKLGL